MFEYKHADFQRRHEEAPKRNGLGKTGDNRDAFARDRDRVLHSAALRRLADKTQVVGPRDGDTPRTRLTHSLEVGQIGRGIAKGLGLNPDLVDMAGLTHDIGHPPYGHNGENALNEVAHNGFEGNAQTLRILTKLEPKVVGETDKGLHSYGLNLTRASLDAACKYPWLKTNPDGTTNRKYGAYDEDAEILNWIRQGTSGKEKCVEAQVMDWSDDVAYSVHDVEDGIISRRISLSVLWDIVELATLAEKGARAFGSTADELIAAADSLSRLDVIKDFRSFDYSLLSYAALKKMTSELVGRYVGATVTATREHQENAELIAHGQFGRHQGTLVVSPQAVAEVKLLKTIAVLYVMDNPEHLARQDRQRERIYRVYDYLVAGAPGSLDAMFAQWWLEADTAAEQDRVIIDQIASMTESRLECLARRAAQFSGFLG